jgi:chemotaxis protein methyltransferase WspC
MTRVESLLRREIGLDAASIGSTLIQRTVRLRMKDRGLKKVEDYERLLESSAAALDELIEAVVVTETCFFRDREPFAAFAQMALQWLPKNPAGTLRTLSVPCSSGEEPYSLAMALADLSVPPHRFLIDGVDISERALERARHAVYGKNSFRGKDLSFRDRHFRPSGRDYTLKTAVRECVRFHRDNLLGNDFLADRPPYDFIFCRNLLIYFDRATQLRALEKLHRLLAPDGILFVGPAELPLVAGNGFVSANLPMAFACRKTSAPTQGQILKPEAALPAGVKPRAGHAPFRGVEAGGPATAGPQGSPRGIAVSREVGPGGGNIPRGEPTDTIRDASPAPESGAPHTGLDVARQLADAGRLAEAVALCQTHLRQQGPTAQAYYLLGLLCDASGDAAAGDHYRKALYLEPNHYDTLLQLSLLLEKHGDRTGAATLRSRLKRLDGGKPSDKTTMKTAPEIQATEDGRAYKRRADQATPKRFAQARRAGKHRRAGARAGLIEP